MPTARDPIRPATRAEWREWLAANHDRAPGVVVEYQKRNSPVTGPTYEDIVEEALCFGWIDGTLRPVDDDVTSIWFSPRKPGSVWAASNKARVERLSAVGLMAPAGLAKVERARADGSWNALDDVDGLVLPEDLAAAFERHPGARERYDALSPSARRQVLYWVYSAKRADTRARRVDLAAAHTQAGLRPDQWPRG